MWIVAKYWVKQGSRSKSDLYLRRLWTRPTPFYSFLNFMKVFNFYTILSWMISINSTILSSLSSATAFPAGRTTRCWQALRQVVPLSLLRHEFLGAGFDKAHFTFAAKAANQLTPNCLQIGIMVTQVANTSEHMIGVWGKVLRTAAITLLVGAHYPLHLPQVQLTQHPRPASTRIWHCRMA